MSESEKRTLPIPFKMPDDFRTSEGNLAVMHVIFNRAGRNIGVLFYHNQKFLPALFDQAVTIGTHDIAVSAPDIDKKYHLHLGTGMNAFKEKHHIEPKENMRNTEKLWRALEETFLFGTDHSTTIEDIIKNLRVPKAHQNFIEKIKSHSEKNEWADAMIHARALAIKEKNIIQYRMRTVDVPHEKFVANADVPFPLNTVLPTAIGSVTHDQEILYRTKHGSIWIGLVLQNEKKHYPMLFGQSIKIENCEITANKYQGLPTLRFSEDILEPAFDNSAKINPGSGPEERLWIFLRDYYLNGTTNSIPEVLSLYKTISEISDAKKLQIRDIARASQSQLGQAVFLAHALAKDIKIEPASFLTLERA